jgi:hypothetical protein
LPEPAIRFSRINLNNTNILERANLNNTFLNYWELFKKSTYVKNVFIDSLDQEIEFKEEDFATGIKNFVLEIPSEDTKSLTRKQVYKYFVDTIVPKIKVIFNLMKKYINGKLSIIDVVNYLEPFLIYTDNLTYMQYREIVKFINTKISEYNKNFVERSRIFLNLKRTRNDKIYYDNAYSIINMIDNTRNTREEVFDTYGIFDIRGGIYSNSEILQIITLKDYCKLYTSALSIQSVPLMFPSEFSPILENETQQIDNQIKLGEKNNECKNMVVAKLYNTEAELKGDNDRIIFFDKKYDNTDYGFLDNYAKEMIEKTPEDFIEFLINKIKEKKKLNDQDAEILAETLINGYKTVLDGQYAILYDQEKYDQEKKNNEYAYYVRNNEQWVFDPNIDLNLVTDSQNILCNLQPTCISTPGKIDDKCDSFSLKNSQLQQTLLQNVMNEFDIKYNISKQEFEENTMMIFDYNLNILPFLIQIQNYNMTKYNDFNYLLGEKVDASNPSTVSPYAKLKNIIMGQQDFVKKNYDIIKFVNLFTRRAVTEGIGPLGEVESDHWLYCLKTNAKLMPMFIHEMASSYITNINEPQKYNEFVEIMISRIGAVLSSDGDAWIDIHSGEEIKKISFSEDEGYEDGFKITSHAVLEKEISIRNTTEGSFKKYDTPNTIMMNNIINAVSVSMGINIESQKEFIMSCVLEKLSETLPKESDYEKDIKDMANKGKIIPSYKDVFNSSILYYTLGMILIAIQTITPSIKSRKTFPGCVKSFDGYPFDGAGDQSSLKYIACIAYKIRSATNPWNVLMKKKESFIETKIKECVDGLLSMPLVKRKMNEKTEYLILNPTEDIPEEHSILGWTQFLPPLVPIKLKQLLNISSEFQRKLEQELKVGSREQREKILIIESKIIFFSLAIQEKIQNILKKKQLILHKSSNEPYLENSCCNEKDNITTLQYFEKEDSSITEFNNIVKNLTNIISDINFYTKPLILYSNANTKNIYPSISNNYDEETIILAFIKYCNFKSLKPVDPDLITFCSSKPQSINENDSLIEIIRKLKDDGRVYSETQLLQLIQAVSQKNIVNVVSNRAVVSSFSNLTKAIDSINEDNDELIGGSLIELIQKCVDTYDIASEEITKETKALNNKLITDNKSLKKEIIDFIKSNKSGDIKASTIKNVSEFINDLNDWNIENKTNSGNISNAENYNIINFFKTFIQNIIKVFPNIILNKVDYSLASLNFPKHWNLSGWHYRNIFMNVSAYYTQLTNFYGDKTILNVLQEIQKSANNVLLLANNTPSFTPIKTGQDKELKPIFDDKTSRLLFEHYLLLVFSNYISLSDMDDMIVTEVKKPVSVSDIFSVGFGEDSDSDIEEQMVMIEPRVEMETNVLKGNKKELKQKIAGLLVAFIQIMDKQKETIDISYENIEDRVFKLKEKEKDLITDRLKALSEEERDIDTVLKINKLGVWNKGLQKGLTKYVKGDYEEQSEFAHIMQEYEKTVGKKVDTNKRSYNQDIDDYIEENHREQEIEREAYDISDYRDDYGDGVFEGDNDFDNDNYADNGDYDS